MKTLEIINEMSKEEMVEYILTLQERGNGGPKRKDQVLELIEEKARTIEEIAELLAINNKNVSSQLTYLRKDGHAIMSYQEDGKRMIALMG